MAGDWFSDNAPAQGGGDWFSKNAPTSMVPHPDDANAAATGAGHGIAKALLDVAMAPSQHFASGFYEGAVKPMADLVMHPIDSAKAAIETGAGIPEMNQIAEHVKAGDYKSAFLATLKYAGLGPGGRFLAGMVAPIKQDIEQGHYTKALGHAAGTAATMLAPGSEGEAAVIPKIANPNAAEGAALDYLQSKGVNVPAGARTGNAFVKNVQKGVDSTPIGAVIAQKEGAANTAALRAESGRLVQNAAPEIPADTHYAAFRAAAQNPKNTVPVVVGTKEVQSGVLDASGQPITKTVPIKQDVALPVNVKGLKAQIKPIFDDVSRWWEPAKRNASAGYQAMKSILEGPDVVPAADAENGLSGLKALARESDGKNAGVAKYIIPKLQQMVDDAAARGGPDVVKALQEGRNAAAREVAVGKLQKIFDKATAEGGFNREAGIWQDWLRSRPEVKRLLPESQVSDLDKFFLGAKKLAENPNPSGSGTIITSMGTGGLIFTHPLTGVPITLGAGVLSKLLHSPAGVKALTEGMKIPVKAPAAVAAASRIMKAAGDAGAFPSTYQPATVR